MCWAQPLASHPHKRHSSDQGIGRIPFPLHRKKRRSKCMPTVSQNSKVVWSTQRRQVLLSLRRWRVEACWVQLWIPCMDQRASQRPTILGVANSWRTTWNHQRRMIHTTIRLGPYWWSSRSHEWTWKRRRMRTPKWTIRQWSIRHRWHPHTDRSIGKGRQSLASLLSHAQNPRSPTFSPQTPELKHLHSFHHSHINGYHHPNHHTRPNNRP